MKSHFHMKRWAPRLALRKRLKVIRKWPIKHRQSVQHKNYSLAKKSHPFTCLQNMKRTQKFTWKGAKLAQHIVSIISKVKSKCNLNMKTNSA